MASYLLSVAALAVTLMSGIVSSQSVNGATYNKPSAGPPASFFAATSTVNVQALKTAAAQASKVPKSAAYPVSDGGPTATIHNDWVNFATVRSSLIPFHQITKKGKTIQKNRIADADKLIQGAAIVFVADMDVDCDGIDYKCKVRLTPSFLP